MTFVHKFITLFFFGLFMVHHGFASILFYQELLLAVSVKDFHRVEEHDNRCVLWMH